MNAQIIMTKVNEMLKELLGDFYDNITNEIITESKKNANNGMVSIEHIKTHVKEMKSKFVNFENLNDDLKRKKSIDENTEKPVIPDENELNVMKRKDIQALCKIYSIPGRQKNTELISALLVKKNEVVPQKKPTESKKIVVENKPENKVQIKVKPALPEVAENLEAAEEAKVDPKVDLEEAKVDEDNESDNEVDLEDAEEEIEEDDEEENNEDKGTEWDDHFFADEDDGLQEEEYISDDDE